MDQDDYTTWMFQLNTCNKKRFSLALGLDEVFPITHIERRAV